MSAADPLGGYTALVGRLRPSDDVEAVLREISHQAPAPDEVLLLDDGASFGSPRRRQALTGRPGLRLVAVPPGHSAVARNAALREVRTPFFLFVEPGFHLHQDYLAKALEVLRGPREPAFVASHWTFSIQGETRSVEGGAALDDLLADVEAVHGAAVVSRAAWEAAGGFDESLPELEDYELFLRLAAAGREGVVIAEPLVSFDASASPAWRRRVDRSRYLPALRAVFDRHRRLFEANPVASLLARERRVLQLWDRYRMVQARHEEFERASAELRRRIEETAGFVRARGRPTLDWGDLRRVYPIDPDWGYARGKPVDRHYIERFLAENAADIRGVVLEVQENDYTRAFGGDRVERSEVLDVEPGNPRATVVDDLRTAATLPGESYDCIILTQTLHVIDDMEAVLEQCRRILRPGGVLLATLPCVSRVCLEYGPEGDFWRLTEAGARHLFRAAFGDDHIRTRAYGNVLASAAFLYGLPADELRDEEFAAFDPFNPTLIGVRAQKPGTPKAAGAPEVRATRRPRGLVLLYHRVAAEGADVHHLCVRPETFAAHMQTLARHALPMPLRELVARAAASDLPDGAVAVTFDDGYADALSAAVPALDDARVPATFFVCSEPAGHAPEFWWDTLERVLLAPETVPHSIRLRLGGRLEEMPLPDPAARRQAHDRLHGHLVRAGLAELREVMRQITAQLPEPPSPGRRFRLQEADLRRLAADGAHVVGAHGVHHLALSHQPEETVRQEVMEARTGLERILGWPVTTFAYPYGDVSDVAVELVRAGAYELAVTCEPRPVEPGVDRFRVPRVEIQESAADAFAARLAELLGA